MDAEVNVKNIFLETERLILRDYRASDLQDFYEYASEKDVGEMAGWNYHKSIEESKAIMELFLEENKTMAIVYKENNKVIGSIGIEEIREEVIGNMYGDLTGRELGYALSKKYWGMGIMPEALKCLIKYLFEEENYDFLYVCHFNSNIRSQRVIEKCGFIFLKEEILSTTVKKEEAGKVYILKNRLKSRKLEKV